MATTRTKILSMASAVGLLAGGWVCYSLFAAQARPGDTLAQAPLNNQVQIPPAFVMAVDDSGSMSFETLFPGRDGYACWSTSSDSFWSGSELRTSGNCNFHHLIPHSGDRYRIDTGRYAIPPIDEFGFARSPEINPQYFNPFSDVVYEPWRRDDGSLSYPQASVTATRVDPRDTTPTINLFADRAQTGGAELFRVYEGMVIPAGTLYREGNQCDGLAGAANSWQSRNYDQQIEETCNIAIQYYPAVFYLKTTTAPPAGFLPGARVLAEDACGNGCDMYRYEIKPANYSSPAAFAAAAQKFANWFSFYGNRNRAMIGGMTLSLADVNNIRVGYFQINQHGSFDNPVGNAGERVEMYDMGVAAERTSLYTRMTALPASGSTPNRQAVSAGASQFTRTDSGAPIKLACQKNALMLFTDGYSNQNTVSSAGNADGGMGVPFQDGHSNTMADIVSRYYLSSANGGLAPLRSGTGFPAGQVRVPDDCKLPNPPLRLDCQTDLHLNFFGITLGARGYEYDPDVDRDPFAAPYPTWPSAQNDNPSTVDDIWHATVNTRGDFINAKTPADITAAMRRVLQSVTGGSSPSGTIAVTGARVGPSSLAVEPEYDIRNEGTDWYSKLTAYTPAVDPDDRSIGTTMIWEAGAEMPAWSARRAFFTSGGTVRAFNSTNVSLAALCNKPTQYAGMSRCSATELSSELGATAAEAVRYLLGDASLEKKNGGRYRDRTAPLGDIVNSSPVVSSPLDNYGYFGLGGSLATSYAAFLQAKKDQSVPFMVYVGANDGMLHGFNGGMNGNLADNGRGGQEEFAYIPATALGHMGNLLFPYDAADQNDQKFVHRYFVDGQVTVSDSYYGSAWHTTLVGASGAGGRSVFALDVTDPTSFGTSKRLWEISDLDTTLPAAVRANIGHVLAKPVIVPLRTEGGTDRWVAIFGNGYNSASGKAVLFIVDIAAGTPTIRMIEAVETGAGVPQGPNGLGNIVAVDRWSRAPDNTLSWRSSDGYADTVYAADQKGALWKFDLRSVAPSNLATPLFVTRSFVEGGQTYRQPIIGGLTAAAGLAGGVNLYFGTGSFSFTEDPQDTSQQSLYSINDTVNGAISTTLSRANLHGGSIVAGGTAETRGVQFSGAAPLGSAGWYVDLTSGERFVGNPRIVAGVLFMPTYNPGSSASDCANSGFNWLYGLDSRTGSAALFNARLGSPDGSSVGTGVAGVALNTGGNAPVKELGVSVLPRAQPGVPPAGGGPTPPPGFACWMQVSTAGLVDPLYLPYPCGRQSWRQIQ